MCLFGGTTFLQAEQMVNRHPWANLRRFEDKGGLLGLVHRKDPLLHFA
jgi:hypothetical protein